MTCRFRILKKLTSVENTVSKRKKDLFFECQYIGIFLQARQHIVYQIK